MLSERSLVDQYLQTTREQVRSDRNVLRVGRDVEVHDFSSPGTIHGREAYLQYFSAYRSGIANLTISILRAERIGRQYSVWTTYQGRHVERFMGVEPSNGQIRVLVPKVLRLNDGSITDLWTPGWVPFADVLEDGGVGQVDPDHLAFASAGALWDRSLNDFYYHE